MIVYYFMLSISIIFCSWTIGLLVNTAILKKSWYSKMSNFNIIKSDDVNKYMGLPLMRSIIRKSFWRKFNPTLKISKRPDCDELLALRHEMTSAEIGHFVAFIAILITVGILMILEKLINLIIPLLILNIFLNLYPSLLQQLNKRRLDKIIKRQKCV